MNIHVFVVNQITFKQHLEYMFAGTGVKNRMSLFLEKSDIKFQPTTERNLVGMIADISRIRPDDKIIFYLQATVNNPGMFFGIFKAKSAAFFDENDNKNYLSDELGKGLSYRIEIEADTVYSYGITEHEYLDDLTGKEAPYELCWSLIYRKLKGNRGCTMITPYEFEDLLCKIKKKNQDNQLKGAGFTFDEGEVRIITAKGTKQYNGRRKSLDIKPRLLYKAGKKNAFETHLQAYVMQKYDDGILKKLLLPLGNGSAWVGNEVACGVGMQKIDTLIIEQNDEEIHVKVVELKDEEPYEYILSHQLRWYLQWVSQYIVPNLLKYKKPVVIHPCILARKTDNIDIIEKIRSVDLINSSIQNVSIAATEYIAFDIVNNDITFEKVV